MTERFVSVRLAELERGLKELEERAEYLASRADETEGVVENIEANVLGRLGTIEAWAQSTDEVLSSIVEAERAGVPTYDPATEVVVSREDVREARYAVDCGCLNYGPGSDHYKRSCQLSERLRRALAREEDR